MALCPHLLLRLQATEICRWMLAKVAGVVLLLEEVNLTRMGRNLGMTRPDADISTWDANNI